MHTSFWGVVKKMRWVSWEYFWVIYLHLIVGLFIIIIGLFLTDPLDKSVVIVMGGTWAGSILSLLLWNYYGETKAELSKGETKQ